MKKLISIILSVITLMSFMTGCASSENRKDNLYNPEYKDIALANIFFVTDDSSENASIGTVKESMDEIGFNSKNHTIIPEEDIKFLKDQMTSFFEEVYDVDIADKLSSINTYTFESNDGLYGYHIPGSTDVYVNGSIYRTHKSMFASTWCHEVIHLIGINYIQNEFYGIYECITEAVNTELMDWMNNPHDTTSAYYSTINIGKQLIMANPEIVRQSILDPDYRIENEIDSVLKDARYIAAKPPKDSSIAFQLSCYIISKMEEAPMYFLNQPFLDFMMQEITTAYCRSFNLTEEQIENSKNLWIVNNFDEVTINGAGYGYVIK